MNYYNTLYDILTRAATRLPDDVRAALSGAAKSEAAGSSAAEILAQLDENIALAEERGLPICQDTGTIQIFVRPGNGFRRDEFLADLAEATRQVTAKGCLRANCVRALSGRNSGDNTGEGSPAVHWLAPSPGGTEVTVLLKGGGSENMGCQYSLPDQRLGAGRDAEGVRRCVLDAVTRIQGQGCAPGILGVAVGGDRASGYEAAKELLLRKIGERNSDPSLAALETRLLAEANSLGIGPMGLGGRTTLLEVFVTELTRHPACFFVSIAYNCWCCRRVTAVIPEDAR